MNIFLPQSLDDLWNVSKKHPKAQIMAGGTDLLVRLRGEGKLLPTLTCLERIAELQSVEESGGTVQIGSAATLTSLLQNEIIRTQLPILHSSISELGSPLIRNMGTIGGNICTGSPAGDTLPALYVLGAELVLRSATGERIVPISDFIKGPGQTELQDNEILYSIQIPLSKGFNLHHFEKVGQRKALAIAIVSFAAMLHIEDNIVQKARFAWGSVGPTIVQSREVEAVVEGKRLSLTTLKAAANLATLAVTPINDLRATCDYRKQVAGNLLLRLATKF